jgi:nuclear pore complex protein Nup88
VSVIVSSGDIKFDANRGAQNPISARSSRLAFSVRPSVPSFALAARVRARARRPASSRARARVARPAPDLVPVFTVAAIASRVDARATRPRRRAVVSLVVVAVPVVVVVPVVARRRPRVARATRAVAAVAAVVAVAVVAIASTDAPPTTTATGRARVYPAGRYPASSGMQSVISRLSDRRRRRANGGRRAIRTRDAGESGAMRDAVEDAMARATRTRARRRATRDARKGERRTFGTAANARDDAGRERGYLKKNEGAWAAIGAAIAREEDAVRREARVRRKAATPGRGETWTARRDGEARNWVRENALEAIRGEASTARGARKGSSEGAFAKEDYGRVPAYLVEFNRERERSERLERETRDKNSREREAAGRMRDDERRALIEGLRAEHAKISSSYQKLPFVVDTPNRRARKEAHELKLARIESDINLLGARTVFIEG